MKKKLIAGLAAASILIGCAGVAWAGSSTDYLISLNYLNGTYTDSLKEKVAGDVKTAMQPLYEAALAKAGLTPDSGSGGRASADSFTAGQGVYGDTLTLSTGSGLIWTAGTGYVNRGVLVDATAGKETAAGVALTAGHRYIAGEETEVITASQTAQWMVEGTWRRGSGGTVVVPLTFVDVSPDAWYYDDVRYVVEKGLFQGLSVDTFAPGNTMQRSMMTTVLHRLAGEPAAEYAAVFSDIPDGQWYTRGTIWCAQVGVVSGMGDGTFAPGADVTRQQIAVMLRNYAVKMGYAVNERGDLSGFSDTASVADWAQDAVSWAVGAGLLNGSDGALLPGNNATRAQVAAMLHRFQAWMEQSPRV